jgi:hypothetical protein
MKDIKWKENTKGIKTYDIEISADQGINNKESEMKDKTDKRNLKINRKKRNRKT